MAAVSLRGINLVSARAKLRRADQHSRSLIRSLQRFRDRDPYAQTIPESGGRPGPGLVTPIPGRPGSFRDYYTYVDYPLSLELKANRRVPALVWGVLIGEIAHNLCSALDNFVWAASVKRMRQNPLTPGQESNLAFPVCLDGTTNAWPSARGSALRYVEPSVQALIKSYQPFDRWQSSGRTPADHPFAIVNKLWNWDKHRFVQTVTGAAGLQGAAGYRRDLGPQLVECSAKIIEVAPPGPIEGKTHVGVVRVHLPEPIGQTTNLRMQVKANYALDVLFGQGSPAPGDSVRAVLAVANEFVARLLRGEPYQP